MNLTRHRYSKYVKLLLYVLVIVLVNVAGLTLFFRADLTRDKVYSLSQVSKEVVATLSEPLTIKVFFTKDLPAPHNQTERYLRDLLKEYALEGNKFFNYRFHNVSAEAEGLGGGDSGGNRVMARDYGINPVQIQIVEEDEVKFKQAFMGLVLIHGDIIERIPTIASVEGLEYKLTTAIQKLNHKVSALLNLDEKIEVRLVLSSSIHRVAPYMDLEQLKDYPDEIKKIVAELNPKTYNQLTFAHIDPGADADTDQAGDSQQVMELAWPAIAEAGITPGRGRIGLILRYKEQARVIPLLQVLRLPIFGTQYQLASMEQVEDEINANLERLININQDLGYLGDHGTLQVVSLGSRSQQTLRRFSTLINPTYNLKTIRLKDENIPEGLKCLIIARPTEKLSDYALYQIDQALMRGTNLAIYSDAFHESRPAGQQSPMAGQMPNYVPMDTGLEKLLNHYGVRIKKSLVLDKNSYRQRRSAREGGGEMPIYYAPIIQNEFINKKLDYIKNIKGLITLMISPLELDAERIEAQGLTAHRLLSSSEKSWEMRDRIILNPAFVQPPDSDEEMSSFPLAYLLEGSFSSYFKGKPMPEKPQPPDPQGEDVEKMAGPGAQPKADLSQITGSGTYREESLPAKIFVMASSALLSDQLLDDRGESTNSMFVINMLDALNGRQEIATMRAKVQRFNPLRETGAAVKTVIKAFNIVGLPILVVLAGLITWMRRHARCKRIQLQFQK